MKNQQQLDGLRELLYGRPTQDAYSRARDLVLGIEDWDLMIVAVDLVTETLLSRRGWGRYLDRWEALVWCLGCERWDMRQASVDAYWALSWSDRDDTDIEKLDTRWTRWKGQPYEEWPVDGYVVDNASPVGQFHTITYQASGAVLQMPTGEHDALLMAGYRMDSNLETQTRTYSLDPGPAIFTAHNPPQDPAT